MGPKGLPPNTGGKNAPKTILMRTYKLFLHQQNNGEKAGNSNVKHVVICGGYDIIRRFI
jgi:hypothetical protein